MGDVELDTLTSYLDEYLGIPEFPDYPGAQNGLQVEGSGRIDRIVACTDACQATIEAAIDRDADLMIVHHGLFWGSGVQPLTGRAYRRVRGLIANDIALYSAHLPLDAHPDVGNNAELARGIELQVRGGFGEYEDVSIGLWGELEIEREELVRRVDGLLRRTPRLIAAGPERCRRVGVLTGGGGSFIARAHAAGLDTFITGEGRHHTYFDAEELGVNVLYAGHYATETLGVRALAAHVSETFGVASEFVDHPTGL